MELSLRVILCGVLADGSLPTRESIRLDEVVGLKRWVRVCSCACVLIIYIIAALFTNETASVLAENKPILAKQTVIIDAGHGGEDGGATSCTGVLESGINLEIACRLKDILNLFGYHTIMTRTDNNAIHTEGSTIAQRKISDLKNRVSLVNNTPNALLLSIHQNYFTNSRYRGAQVFYANTERSRCLAESIQNSFLSTINPGSKRMAKKAANIYLMEKVNCDGVLVECGFLSNKQEEAMLRDPEYQKKVCAVIASETSVYLHDNPLLT